VEDADSPEDTLELVSCGHAWFDMQIRIVNPDTMMLSASNEIGEIWVSGPSVSKGYYNNPEETAKTFSAFLKDTEEGPFLRTGDLGFNKHDELYITGRLKDLIIIRGTNHYPQDIEYTIEKSHPAIRKNAGACFSIDAEEEERLVVVNEIERSFIANLEHDVVFDAIRMKLANNHSIQPFSIVLIRTGSIPKTTSGKIQRQACKKAYLHNELSVLHEWKMELPDSLSYLPGEFSKEKLRNWLVNWLGRQKNLDPSSIDPEKPITSYGLDSLLAVNLEKEVNDTFGISWPIESFLQENTINQLVEEGERLLQEKK
jgi:acyl carrier protein